MNKLWRLVFTLLVTGLCLIVGWYAARGFLRAFVESDTPLVGPAYFSHNGFFEGLYYTAFVTGAGIFGFALGGATTRRIEMLGERFRQMSVRDKLALICGLVIGIVLSAIIALPIIFLINDKSIAVAASLAVGLILIYLTTTAAVSMKDDLRSLVASPSEEKVPQQQFKIVDTNVIIDGRIADIAKAGFIEGTIYVPGFVLDELQHIADSADHLRRARGRRGLDTLNQMDKNQSLVVRTYDRFAPASGEVDGRLVQLAKSLNGSLVTNDWNLNKVAELQGVPVLNINELANALKPVVLPGEEMQVAVVKEGREASQGVGYLDDGTMIVVEGGRTHLGETVEVIVSSVLQTSAGKMIFAHLRDEEGDDIGGVRAYTGGGPRRPVRRSARQ